MSEEQNTNPDPSESQVVPPKGGTPGTNRAQDNRRILEACVKPRTLAELVKMLGIPKSTLQRKLKRLVRKGLLRFSSESYQTVQHQTGIALETLMCTPSRDRMEKLWPFIAQLPTPAYRAIVKLVILAVIARKYDLGGDYYVSFLLVGGTQQLKSTNCELICIVVGADLTKCRVNVMQVRGRGLLVRLGPKGEVQWTSEALQEPVAWLEEVSLAEPGIERDLFALIHGGKQVKIENNIVDVEAVGLLEMNPVRREGSLTERIGMAPQRIRRMIVLDVDRLLITDAMRVKCRELLDQIRTAKPIELPSPASGQLSPELRMLVLQNFRSCLNPGPEFRDLVDPARLLPLIEAARSILDDREACRLVLECYLTIAETTDLARPDWAERLAATFPHVLEPGAEAISGPASVTGNVVAEANPELSEVLDACANTDEPNPYVQASVEAQLVALLSDLGLRIPENEGLVRATLSAGRQLAAQGVKPDAFPALISRAGELNQWDTHLRQQGIDDATLQQLLRLNQEMRAHEIGPEQVPGFLAWHAEMNQLGLLPRLVAWLAYDVQKRIVMGALPEEVLQDWLRMAEENNELEVVADGLQYKIAEREEKLEELKSRRQTLLKNIAQADAELLERNGLIQASKELIDELKRSTEQRKRILDEYGDMLDSVRADLDGLRQAREEARDALRN
jgi:DNA-binding Lrp family transcriptional regulator